MLPIRIGLISDTHAPERLPKLPEAIFDALRGVDFVLHAGDVGELWVLDELSRIAPVMAVHGNDDTVESQRELPYQQIITINGKRILLTHSHWPEREAEIAARREDAWLPKLQRRADLGKRAGASIVVYGHTHVPMAHTYDSVLLVNPGAIASGNYITRQRLQSVSILSVAQDSTVLATHSDLAIGAPFVPQIDWNAGFRVALDRVSASILLPRMAQRWESVHELAQPIWPQFRAALLRAGNRVWSGELEAITPNLLLTELRKEAITSKQLAQLEDAMR